MLLKANLLRPQIISYGPRASSGADCGCVSWAAACVDNDVVASLDVISERDASGTSNNSFANRGDGGEKFLSGAIL